MTGIDRFRNEEVHRRVDIYKCIKAVWTRALHWFGHMEIMDGQHMQKRIRSKVRANVLLFL